MEQYKPEELGIFITKHNPFLVKDQKGNLLKFENYADMYYYMLVQLFLYCKRGYIDIVVAVWRFCHFDAHRCFEIERYAMKRFQRFRQQYICVDWRYHVKEEQKLKELMMTLHCIDTNSEFEEYSWQMAWERFRNYLNSIYLT